MLCWLSGFKKLFKGSAEIITENLAPGLFHRKSYVFTSSQLDFALSG